MQKAGETEAQRVWEQPEEEIEKSDQIYNNSLLDDSILQWNKGSFVSRKIGND